MKNMLKNANELIIVSGFKEEVEEKLKEIDEKINGPTYGKIKTNDNSELKYDLFRLLLKCSKNDKNGVLNL